MAVRRLLVLLLAATFAAAEDDKEFARVVDGFVRDLGAPEAQVRAFARFRLAAYGDKARPLLERVESDDPEVRRSIRYLTRAKGTETLELLPRPDATLAIGAALVLDVRVINNTEQTLQLLPDAARQQGEMSPFRIRFDGKTPASVRLDQVDWGDNVVILPGTSRRFRITLPGGSSALRRPALHEVSVVFDGTVARGYGTVDPDAVDTGPLHLESAPIQVHVLGRKIEELEKALASDNAREKEAAAKELGMRDDDAVVPILRRHARERPLRLAAIRRLGAAGAEEDFAVIFEATVDENADVRRAAVLGLGAYPTQKARSRLLKLASDRELQSEAIQALRGHKNVATVDCYLSLLSSGGCSPANIRVIRTTILEWTGIAVDERPQEIKAFRGWWEANRARWGQENARGK